MSDSEKRPINKGSNPPEHLEPPPELDRIVIGNARKAIQGGPPVHLYRAPKWALPMTLATAILISFAILLDLSVRAQRAEHEKQVLPARTVEAPAGPPAMQAGSLAANAGSAGSAAQPPPISTAPWPPLASPSKVASSANEPAAQAGTTHQPSPEPARTRLARVEVATTRSRTDSEPAAHGASQGPAAWAAQIEKLRTEGQTAEVEQETKRFHEAYPSYALPVEAPSTDARAQ